jgi:hypothetical protein
MLKVLQNLEPRFEKAKNFIYEELDEINEVVFIREGTVDVGFKINRIAKYAIRFTNEHQNNVRAFAIGSYNCLYGLRSRFIYKCQSDCEGYSIRKPIWIEIVGEDDEINAYVRQNCKFEYDS